VSPSDNPNIPVDPFLDPFDLPAKPTVDPFHPRAAQVTPEPSDADDSSEDPHDGGDEGDDHDDHDDHDVSAATFDADAFEGVQPMIPAPATAYEPREDDDSEQTESASRNELNASGDKIREDSDGASSDESRDDDDSDDDGEDSDEPVAGAADDQDDDHAASGADGEAPPAPRGRRREREGPRESRRESTIEARPIGRQLMIVNDVPGDECRIAVVENGRLEALFMERAGGGTHVGNIYKGRVTNVEPAIQAAFVDFGEGQSGFLHISDLHPKYFPSNGSGSSRTERVGRKIPRRERPLMQEALRKGQEVLVQVLKEGISTKGPTLTSYLSIPGRLMVMMPDMDRVGVSRKVEDEEQRRAMRKILDQLELPEGFGFILRTAGFDRTKTELSRDLAYLTRLWAVMEKRMHSTGAPCLLYSEGDLLIRTIRDMADENVEAIIVDSDEGFRKANAFLQVVAPRSSPQVLYWDRAVPVYHAFDIERQIAMLHSRTVPLPSGGALVIDQTEALVAIDVNSGRSRSARDSETNAYQTNVEAVEEIARQLRLRDLGGVIINDLIDMRSPRHRREIEDRFRNALKRDRAKSTVLAISEFGIVEMTRQRMRPSVRRAHFTDCPHCQGLGEMKKPETVAADSLRDVEFYLTHDKVQRVEMVCSVKVASVLLSAKRAALYHIERTTEKRVDVRISEAIAIDRVDLYAYDERDADVEIDRLPRAYRPGLEELATQLPDREAVEDHDEDESGEQENGNGGGRRRRRRRRKPQPADTTAMILSGTFDDLPDAEPDEDEPTIAEAIEEAKRHERAEHRKQARQAATVTKQAAGKPAVPAAPSAPTAPGARAAEALEAEGGPRRRRRRRRGGRGGRGDEMLEALPVAGDADVDGAEAGAEVEAAAVPPPPPSDPAALHVLAKELELSSKDLLARCREEGMDVKSHMTKLTSEQVDAIKAWYAPPPPPPPPPTRSPARATVVADASAGALEGRDDDSAAGKRKRRRRRRGGRGRNGESLTGVGPEGPASSDDARAAGVDDDGDSDDHGSSDGDEPSSTDAGTDDDGQLGGPRKRRRRRRRGGRGGEPAAGGAASPGAGPARPAQPSAPPKDKGVRGNGPKPGAKDRAPRGNDPRSRGDRPRNAPAGVPPAASSPPPAPPPTPPAPATPKPRSLYGGRIRKLGGPAPGSAADDDR